jgi:hypothetical protein
MTIDEKRSYILNNIKNKAFCIEYLDWFINLRLFDVSNIADIKRGKAWKLTDDGIIIACKWKKQETYGSYFVEYRNLIINTMLKYVYFSSKDPFKAEWAQRMVLSSGFHWYSRELDHRPGCLREFKTTDKCLTSNPNWYATQYEISIEKLESLFGLKFVREDNMPCWTGEVLASGFNKKEKAMKKTEAKEQLEKLQVEVDRLREIVEQEDKKPWRADDNGEYYFISGGGRVARGLDLSYDIDDQRYAKGNYFQTEEEVKALLIYKVLNDKWHYWVAGVNDKPNEIPEGCEYCIGGSWLDEGNDPRTWDYKTRRWPKHS